MNDPGCSASRLGSEVQQPRFPRRSPRAGGWRGACAWSWSDHHGINPKQHAEEHDAENEEGPHALPPMLAKFARGERLAFLEMKRVAWIGQRTARTETIRAAGARDGLLAPALLLLGAADRRFFNEPLLRFQVSLHFP